MWFVSSELPAQAGGSFQYSINLPFRALFHLVLTFFQLSNSISTSTSAVWTCIYCAVLRWICPICPIMDCLKTGIIHVIIITRAQRRKASFVSRCNVRYSMLSIWWKDALVLFRCFNCNGFFVALVMMLWEATTKFSNGNYQELGTMARADPYEVVTVVLYVLEY